MNMVGQVTSGGQTSLSVEVKYDDVRQFPLWQPYGLSTNIPNDDARAVMLYPRDEIAAAGVVLVDVDGAPDLEMGEVALWNKNGALIVLKKDGTIEITGDVTINGNVTVKGTVTTTDDVSVTGNITASDDVMADAISLKNHTHQYIDSKGTVATPTPSITEPPS